MLVVFLLEAMVPSFHSLPFLLGTFDVAELSAYGSPLYMKCLLCHSLWLVLFLPLWSVGFQAPSTMLAWWPHGASFCAQLKRSLFLYWFSDTISWIQPHIHIMSRLLVLKFITQLFPCFKGFCWELWNRNMCASMIWYFSFEALHGFFSIIVFMSWL